MVRERFDFWLDTDKDDHLLLCETIDELKEKRLFSRAIREGLMIWYSLAIEGDTSTLYRIFPALAARMADNDKELRSKLDELLQQLKTERQPAFAPGATPRFKKSGGLKSKVDVKKDKITANDEVAANLLGSLANF